ncbi:MAG: sulfotransferase family 2 domain-containing protein [Chloroflexota bacterium]
MSIIDGRLLIFLHIPKAGGTTLRELMARQYPADQFLNLRNDRQIDADLQALPQLRRDQLRGLAGHVTYGTHTCFNQPGTYFTFLRDPVDRLVSHYAYVRGNPRHFLHDAVVGDDLSLLDYVTSGLSEELSDDQTRRIAGLSPEAVPTAADLETAQRNLADHFSMAGVVERYDESLVLLSRMAGWRRPYYLARNVGGDRRPATVTAEERAAILAVNGLDQQLYDHVRQQLDRAIEEAGPEFAEEMARFQERNRQYQRLWGTAEGVVDSLRAARNRIKEASGRWKDGHPA